MAMKQPVRKKLYRTMQGRMVDIDKLRSANETVPAIGNMNVNARGDVIGQGGKIVQHQRRCYEETIIRLPKVRHRTCSVQETGTTSQSPTTGYESHSARDRTATSENCEHIQTQSRTKIRH
jgi:hypothetical protein